MAIMSFLVHRLAARTLAALVVPALSVHFLAASAAAAPVTTGSIQQSDSGSATSNGYLNTFFSGTVGYVSVPGLNLGTGTASAAGTNTNVNSILDASGSVISRAVFPTGGPTGTPPSPFSGNNDRSSLATSGRTFYGVGTSSGSPACAASPARTMR